MRRRPDPRGSAVTAIQSRCRGEHRRDFDTVPACMGSSPGARGPARPLVGVARSNARNSESMFRNPFPHLLSRPCPFKRVRVQPIVLGPGVPYVIDEFVSTTPRSPLEVVIAESAEQHLRFVEPRGADRSEA